MNSVDVELTRVDLVHNPSLLGRLVTRPGMPGMAGESSVVARPVPDIPIRDIRVARRHALFSSRGGAWWLSDAGSTGGIDIGGQRLSGHHRLRSGESVQFGDTTAHFLSGLDPDDLDLLHQQLVFRLTHLDRATGLHNARWFHRRMAAVVEDANSRNESTSLALFRLESWREHVATVGQPEADDTIRALAELFRTTLGAGRLVGRIREDLVAVVFPEEEPGQVVAICASLVKQAESVALLATLPQLPQRYRGMRSALTSLRGATDATRLLVDLLADLDDPITSPGASR